MTRPAFPSGGEAEPAVTSTWIPLRALATGGIDWSDPADCALFDPYLQWALATGFAGYVRDPEGRVPIGLELLAGDRGRRALLTLVEEGTLRVPSAYLQDPRTRYCTARIRTGDFVKLRGRVQRMELGLTALRDRCESSVDSSGPILALGAWAVDAMPRREPRAEGRVVLGIVDDGCAFAHEQFRDAQGGTRVRWLWCQDGTPDADQHLWAPPSGFEYGAEATGERLMRGSASASTPGGIDEPMLYQRAGMAGLALGLPPHGTRVMDLAAGRVDPLLRQVSEQAPDFCPHATEVSPDTAGQADLVFVQMPRRAMRDASGAWLTVHVLDAVRYILARSDEAAAVVVNISLGAFAGPHDGSSLLEAALDALIEQHAPRLQVVLAAGNGFRDAVHAELNLPPGATQQLRWHVPIDDPTENFVEVWAAPVDPCRQTGPVSGLQVQLTPPGNAPCSPIVQAGHSVAWSEGRPACVLFNAAAGVNGSASRLALVSMAPGQSGFWTLSLKNSGETPLAIQAYIERDDSIPGGLPRQAVFVSDGDESRAPVSAHGTLSSLATGRHTFVVGAHQWRDGALASFSASGPSRDASVRGRIGPDLTAPGTAGLHSGLWVAGALSGGAWVSSQGTSMAAPVVARQLANLLATEAGRALDRRQLIDALVEARRPVQHPRAGWGRLKAHGITAAASPEARSMVEVRPHWTALVPELLPEKTVESAVLATTEAVS